jgi:D-lyxose ketol-isomerase
MKRSEINQLLRQAREFLQLHRFALPPFGHWSPDDWAAAGPEADEIRRCGLGWDITDFGSSDFRSIGLLLFTLRNGPASRPAGAKHYAEKIMIVEPGQVTPWHYHESKMEDIINRGGGRLCIAVRELGRDNQPTDREVTVLLDGIRRTVPAGAPLSLAPGESITVPRRLAHQFWGDPATGKVLVGEVSDVNDDHSDNFFFKPVGRFPALEEDEPPLHLLCTEYPAGKDRMASH